MDKYLGEVTLATLPRDLDNYLVNLLRSDTRSKSDIIDFYIDAALIFPGCCDSLSTYNDKTLIGDIIEYAKPLEGRKK
jgi:hypothetical protein